MKTDTFLLALSGDEYLRLNFHIWERAVITIMAACQPSESEPCVFLLFSSWSDTKQMLLVFTQMHVCIVQ